MASTINASNGVVSGLISTGDTSGELALQTNNGTTALTLDTSQNATFAANVTLNGQGDLRLADADSSNYVGFQAPATVASNVLWTLPSTDGTSGQLLGTNGSGTLSWSTVSGGPNIQTFTSSGTWTKPAGASVCLIYAWGGGGGGGRGSSGDAVGGGGGGACSYAVVSASSMGSTETITIGSGGLGKTSTNGYGAAGGNTTVGSILTAYGGGGGGGGNGASRGGGSGGGLLSAGSTETGYNLQVGGAPVCQSIESISNYNGPLSNPGFGGGSSKVDSDGGNSAYGGGGGGSGNVANGGSSFYGGGGGAGLRNDFGVAGTSKFGGNGGTNGAAGSQPGGGGSASNTAGGDGGAGKVIIYTWS